MARPIRTRGKRKKQVLQELDITSLLDILTILLVFLILNYDSSTVQISINGEIGLPKSESIKPNTDAVVVQVSPAKIWVDSKVVLDTANIPDNTYDQGGRRIAPLYDELVSKKEAVVNLRKNVPNAPIFSGTVNLVVDKSLKYSYLKKLLYTCAEAGFQKYKFVVMGEET